jgi:transposase
MEAKREKIVALLHAEKPIPDIMTQLGTSRRTIFRVKKYLGERGQVRQKPGSGRKPTVVSSKLINTIKGRIRRNPIRSMRGMAKDLKVSERTIPNIVKTKLEPDRWPGPKDFSFLNA